MDLHILFIQRKEDYAEQYAPEALVVWDEHSLDENPEGFEDACKKAIADVGNELWASKVVRIRVDGNKIRKLLVGTPVVDGNIVPEGT
jgi:hypothetical protein